MFKEAVTEYNLAKRNIGKINNGYIKDFIESTDKLIAEVKLESELNKLTYQNLTRENDNVTAVINEYRVDFVLGKANSKGWLAKAMVLVADGYNFNGFAFEKGGKLIAKGSV